MTKISILGCGWLGLPLAKALIENGFSVKGSTTSSEKIPALQKATINPYLIEIGEDVLHGEIDNFLEQSQVLIINIPPKLRGNSPEKFVSKIENILPFIEKSGISS